MKYNNVENLTIISKYNFSIVSKIINNNNSKKKKILSESFFGNLFLFLINKNNKKKEYGFILEDLADVSKEFKKSLLGENVNFENFKKEIQNYFLLVKKAKFFFNRIIISSFDIYEKSNLLNIFTHYEKKKGPSYLINIANNMLADFVDKTDNIMIINNTKFSNSLINYTNYYTAKFPMEIKSLEKIAHNLIDIIFNFSGESKKLIICDLDNTLWGGVLGDLGYDKINLGGHDPIGEAHQDLQKFLKNLKNRGIMLAISSKNEIANVEKVFKKNENMLLSLSDFTEIKCNWEDKAKNIEEILKNLNITSSHVVFIDDSKIERERIKEIFPNIECPNYFDNILEANEFFFSEIWFHNPFFTKEDRYRTSSYLASKDIKITKDKKLSKKEYENWIKNLNVKIKIKNIDKTNTERTIQLFNKTNQLNTITRRLDKKKLFDWLKKNKKINLYFVSDKYADYGMTAIVTYEENKKKIKINDFLMSCRITGRNVENEIINKISKNNKKLVEIKFKHSEKNKPMFDMLKKLGFIFKKNKFLSKN